MTRTESTPFSADDASSGGGRAMQKKRQMMDRDVVKVLSPFHNVKVFPVLLSEFCLKSLVFSLA
jgi:hypothetical protein